MVTALVLVNSYAKKPGKIAILKHFSKLISYILLSIRFLLLFTANY